MHKVRTHHFTAVVINCFSEGNEQPCCCFQAAFGFGYVAGDNKEIMGTVI